MTFKKLLGVLVGSFLMVEMASAFTYMRDQAVRYAEKWANGTNGKKRDGLLIILMFSFTSFATQKTRKT